MTVSPVFVYVELVLPAFNLIIFLLLVVVVIVIVVLCNFIIKNNKNE